MKPIVLKYNSSIELKPVSPYNFDANFHKPSHFPSSDKFWEKGKCWISMVWEEQILGLKFNNKGTIRNPRIKIDIYSRRSPTKNFLDTLVSEIRWRFNFDRDISEFHERYKDDKILAPFIKRWKGMKPYQEF